MTEAIATQALRGHYAGSVPQARAGGTSVPDSTAGSDIVWLTASLQCAEQCAADGEVFLERQDRMKRDASRYQRETDNLRSLLHDNDGSPQDLKVTNRLDALARTQNEKTSEDNRVLLSVMRRGGQSKMALTTILDRLIRMEKSPRGLDDIAPRWHSEFFDQLIGDAENLQDDWISKYEDALKKYIEFFDAFSEALRQNYIEGGDEKNIRVDFTKLRAKLEELAAKFRDPETGGLASFATKQEAEAFIAKLGLEGMHVQQKADGSFAVMVNLGPLEELWVSTFGDGPMDWNISKYNAWVSSKDSIVEQHRHVSQVLGEKYSRNLQIYDSVIKALSSTIESINEADKTYIHNLL
jgi:type III secretion system IpaD/SipD/SspD family effector